MWSLSECEAISKANFDCWKNSVSLVVELRSTFPCWLLVRESFWFPRCQHVPFLVGTFSISKASSCGLSLSPALNLSALPYASSFPFIKTEKVLHIAKSACNKIGPTLIIQDNLPASRHIKSIIFSNSILPNNPTYSQIPSTSSGGHYFYYNKYIQGKKGKYFLKGKDIKCTLLCAHIHAHIYLSNYLLITVFISDSHQIFLCFILIS